MLASISRRVAGSVRTAVSKSQPIRSIHSINGLSHVTSTPTSTPNLSRALPRSSLSAVAAAAAKSSAKASPSSKSSSKKLTPANDPNFKLSPEQVAFYHENGYLVIENFAPDELTTAMRLRAAEIIEDFAKTFSGKSSVFSTTDQVKTSDDYFLTSGDKIRCFFEEGAFDKDGNLKHDVRVSINKIGHALQELDPVFRRFSNSPQLLSIAKSFGYTEPIILQGMYIFKQPMFGGVVSPHQDSTFLYTDPPSTMGYWLAVEDATPENGCLWAVPGSHKIGCLQRFVRSPDGKGTTFEPKTAAKLPTEPAVCLPAKKGTVVLLHGSLVHFSYENKSPISRHAYTVHMIEGHNAQYPADNWLQRFDGKPFMRLTGTC